MMLRRVLRCLMALATPVACWCPASARAAGEPDWAAVSSEAARVLRDYVRIRSVNPAADTRETAAFLRGILEKEGVAVTMYERAPGKVNLLARLPVAPGATAAGAAGAVLLLHHMDVVPVDPARWSLDPFGGEIRDGRLFGRGAMDMKGPGVIHLMAFLALARQRVPLAREVLLLATADEETGGEDGARFMIERHWDAMRPEYVFDEGGFGARDVLAADGRLVFSVSVAEKKILWARLTASGTAGHGSQPIPDNANDALVSALNAAAQRHGGAARPDAPGGVLGEMRRRIGPLASNKFTNAIQRDTVSVTSLRSGVGDPPKANVIPSTAAATLDCRLMPDTDLDGFARALAGPPRGDRRLEVEILYRMDDAPVTPWDTPMFLSLERAIAAEFPGAVVTPSLIPYGTDSNAFRLEGAKAYGITPIEVDAGIVASMHGDAERIPVDQLVRGARVFYNVLKELCGP